MGLWIDNLASIMVKGCYPPFNAFLGCPSSFGSLINICSHDFYFIVVLVILFVTLGVSDTHKIVSARSVVSSFYAIFIAKTKAK